ncbi:S-layer homology domain-containing protein [Cohnella suwonensis]|uniref:S-layer homology domain-containing protein n=1 Tax=Cohnella suwonensis TaxID=696072 RepID=A0ABW0LZN3_9BACL
MRIKGTKVVAMILAMLLVIGGIPGLLVPGGGKAYAAVQSWQAVGYAGFSAGGVTSVSMQVYNGTPYVAYADWGNSGKATVMKYDSVNGWETVGNAGFSAGRVDYVSIQVYNGTPYVAYQDGGNGYKVTVKKYDSGSSAWVTVGSAGFSEGQAEYISLSIATDGTPYVAYSNTVMKYDSGSSAWVTVGSAVFSASWADYISLSIATDGTPYVAYMDGANSGKATVKKYDSVSSAWVTVGSAGFSAGLAEYISLSIATDGTPYVAYMDRANSSKATVKKYDSVSSAWVTVGSAGFSAGQADYMSLSIATDGTPYVAYRDWGNSYKATVMKYDSGSSAWVTVGSAGFSKGQAEYISLSIATDGTPYVAYRDGGNSNKATVMQFNTFLVSPGLTADTTDTDQMHDIEITFADDAAWRAAITKVKANTTSVLMAAGTDYTLSEGKLTIRAGVLDKGNHTISIKATGYTDATVVQDVSHIYTGEGSGAASDPYQIATAGQLNEVRYFLDSGLYYKLTADIDLSGYQAGEGWLPIGDWNTSFQGNMDGNGFKITGLTINRPNTDDPIGLFGWAENANLSNMKLENVTITGGDNVGGLVGESDNGLISNSYVTGSVSGTNYVGGLIGYNYYTTISNSYAAATVSSGGERVGGLVGESHNGLISNSYVTGSVSGTSYVGGLIGENHTTISNSYAAASVSSGDANVGGLVGENTATISNSFYDMGTTGQSDTGKGEPKSTGEMNTQTTYSGWDFDTVWGINSETNGGYPFLLNLMTFTVTYNANDAASGSAPVDSMAYKLGAMVAIADGGSLAKTGYTFAGWNTEAVGSGTSYAAGATLTMGTSDVTLYAQWLSNNALLSSLAVDQAALSPVFSSTHPNYSVDVANAVTSLNFSLAKTDPIQTLTVTGADFVSVTDSVYSYSASNLIVGSNLIQILVTAEDGTQNPYQLTVNRETAASSNANLSGLTLSSGTLSPVFASGTTSYTSIVANSVSSLSVTASVYDSHATMTVNGTAVASGQASGAINLNVGSNLITTIVTAQDGTTKAYTVTVTRAAASTTGGGGGGTTSDKVTSTDGKLTLPAGRTGEVSLNDEVTVSIPADATRRDLRITIEKLAETQNIQMSTGALVSAAYEILKNFPENFSNPVTLAFTFDPSSLKGNQKPVVFYYDEAKKEWVKVGGKVNGNKITVDVDHFTKFAVLAVDEAADVPTTDTTTDVNFSDISGHWAEANIKQAVSDGIVSGYLDGTFKPGKTVTRAEFAVMLMNTLKPQEAGAELTFTDSAKIGVWAQKAVAQAVQAGIIKGYKDGSFRPNAEITRTEMAAMIANALKLSIESTDVTGFADDKDIPSWAKGAVAAIKKLGLMEGTGTNQFNPNAQATRAEAVTVLLKMLAQQSK